MLSTLKRIKWYRLILFILAGCCLAWSFIGAFRGDMELFGKGGTGFMIFAALIDIERLKSEVKDLKKMLRMGDE